jgi:HEAT repeat protein
MARVPGSPSGQARARKPIEVIVREIQQGDEAQRAQTITLLRLELTGAELAQVFPHLIRALKDESEMVRNAAATVVGELSQRPFGEAPVAEEALTALLDDPSPALRARAAKSLGSIAASGRLEAPPPRLVACLDDEDEQVRLSAAEALVEYRKGPELIVPVALRRLPIERPVARDAFTDLFWHVRLEPSVLPLLIGGLSSENSEVRLICTAAINHMGHEARPALPAILTLLRKELDTPHPPDSLDDHDRIIGMAAGAIGEITSDAECPPGSVEILCEILQRRGGARRGSAPGRPDSPGPSARALGPQEECLAEAVWSLGILGRSAAPAVPLLLSTFESAREASNLRGLTAESLAEISRGTPDEDRVLASLASVWKTAPKEQKSAIARALRRLGPKSEQLVEGLRQWPADGTGSQIRRVRYPRSRRGPSHE